MENVISVRLKKFKYKSSKLARLLKKALNIALKALNWQHWILELYGVKIYLREREKIKEAIENEISKDYQIKLTKQVEMQVIITDMNFKLPEKNLIDKLKQQN